MQGDIWIQIVALVQERHNSIAKALELRHSCPNLSNWDESQRIQWNPSIKAIQDGGLWKEVACHEG